MEGYESMDELNKLYVENGKIIVEEPNKGTTKCDGAEIEGPSVLKQDDDGNIWIETKAKVVKIVKILPENISIQNEK